MHRHAFAVRVYAGQFRQVGDLAPQVVETDNGNVPRDRDVLFFERQHHRVGYLIPERDDGRIIKREQQISDPAVRQRRLHGFPRHDADAVLRDPVLAHRLLEALHAVDLGAGLVDAGEKQIAPMPERGQVAAGQIAALHIVAARVVGHLALAPAVQQHEGHVVFLHVFDMAGRIEIRKVENPVDGLRNGRMDHLLAQFLVQLHAQHHHVIARPAQFGVDRAEHGAEVQVVDIVDDHGDIAAFPRAQRGRQGIADIAHPDRRLPDFRAGGLRQAGIAAQGPGYRIHRVTAGFGDVLQSRSGNVHTGSSHMLCWSAVPVL